MWLIATNPHWSLSYGKWVMAVNEQGEFLSLCFSLFSTMCLHYSWLLFSCMKRYWRDFLVVQWLRLCALNGEGLGSIPGQGTRPVHAATKTCFMLQWGWQTSLATTKTVNPTYKTKSNKLWRLQDFFTFCQQTWPLGWKAVNNINTVLILLHVIIHMPRNISGLDCRAPPWSHGRAL